MTPFQKFIQDLVTKGFEYFGRYYSTYEGFVEENEDPLHMSRIQVSVPEVSGSGKIGKWALPINNFSGDGYGSQVIPPKKSLVWVSFKYGNPKAPMYSHGYHSTTSKPTDLRDIKKFWFITPGGQKIILDDTNNIITIIQKDGTTLKVTKEDISLGGNNIYLGKLDSAEHPIAFGDHTKSSSKEITEYLQKIDSDLAILGGFVGSLIGDPTMGGMLTRIQQRLSTLPDLLLTIEKIPSTKVKSE